MKKETKCKDAVIEWAADPFYHTQNIFHFDFCKQNNTNLLTRDHPLFNTP